jgi:hypothetical protein
MERIECFLVINGKQYAAALEFNRENIIRSVDNIRDFCDTIYRTYTRELGLIDQNTGDIIGV